jgi:hypothetical protein
MLRKTLLLAALALTMIGTLAVSRASFDGGDPIPPCSPKTCPQGPGR